MDFLYTTVYLFCASFYIKSLPCLLNIPATIIQPFKNMYRGAFSLFSLHFTCSVSRVPPVQHECIPQAILGMDVICQAKSGMGKTAVFVLTTLHQLPPAEELENHVHVLVLCHTRELAYQIAHEYERFSN